MGVAMDLLTRGNDALKVNPVTGVDEALAVHGSDWLWAATAIYIMALVRIVPLTTKHFYNY
jgi:Bacteriorhodopsin